MRNCRFIGSALLLNQPSLPRLIHHPLDLTQIVLLFGSLLAPAFKFWGLRGTATAATPFLLSTYREALSLYAYNRATVAGVAEPS